MFLFMIFILLQEEVPILGNVGPRDNCGSTYVRLGDNALYVVGACRGRVEGGRGGGGEGGIWAVQPRPVFFGLDGWKGSKLLGVGGPSQSPRPTFRHPWYPYCPVYRLPA